MCNHYRLNAMRSEVASAFAAEMDASSENAPGEDIFPSGKKTAAYGTVIVADGIRRLIRSMEWGVPTQVPNKRDPEVRLAKFVTNVRNLSSPFWRSMLMAPARRCLVPVSSFSEYGQVARVDGRKPLHWFDVPSRPLFAFARIWRPTERGDAYAFLTTEPNTLVAPIHPKAMPVILHDEDHDRWLRAPWSDLQSLVAPSPSQLMRAG